MTGLFIYRITQDEETWYDTFDSAVVVSSSPEEAAKIHPYGGLIEDRQRYGRDWASKPENVTVEKIGVITGDLGNKFKDGEVIVASFNAG